MCSALRTPCTPCRPIRRSVRSKEIDFSAWLEGTSRPIPALRGLAASAARSPSSAARSRGLRGRCSPGARGRVSSCFFPSLGSHFLSSSSAEEALPVSPCFPRWFLAPVALCHRLGSFRVLSESRLAHQWSPNLCGWDGEMPRQGAFQTCPSGSSVWPTHG